MCCVDLHFSGESPCVGLSLSDLTVSLVLEKITSSSIIEGLWLCRRHQLKDQQQVNRTVAVYEFDHHIFCSTSKVVATIYKITNVS